MYGLLWRAVPGRAPLKVLLLGALLVAVLAALFTWVFPAVAPFVPFNDQTVEEGA